MAPSLHPASYAYAYDQCTNRSRWAHEHGVHGCYPAKDATRLSSAATGGTTAHAYSTACAPQNDAVILKILLMRPRSSAFAERMRGVGHHCTQCNIVAFNR